MSFTRSRHSGAEVLVFGASDKSIFHPDLVPSLSNSSSDFSAHAGCLPAVLPSSSLANTDRRQTMSAKNAASSSATPAVTSAAGGSQFPAVTALPPKRHHTLAYHEPLLLYPGSYGAFNSHRETPLGQELLSWYTSVAETRGMPWRQEWIRPDEERYVATAEGRAQLRKLLERRAYEVWISEISESCPG